MSSLYRFTVGHLGFVSCLTLGDVVPFATLLTNPNDRACLTAMSHGDKFCVVTCNEQLGGVDVNWFSQGDSPKQLDDVSKVSSTDKSETRASTA